MINVNVSPHKGPVTQNFDVFFNLRMDKWLSKQSSRRWSETLGLRGAEVDVGGNQ